MFWFKSFKPRLKSISLWQPSGDWSYRVVKRPGCASCMIDYNTWMFLLSLAVCQSVWSEESRRWSDCSQSITSQSQSSTRNCTISNANTPNSTSHSLKRWVHIFIMLLVDFFSNPSTLLIWDGIWSRRLWPWSCCLIDSLWTMVCIAELVVYIGDSVTDVTMWISTVDFIVWFSCLCGLLPFELCCNVLVLCEWFETTWNDYEIRYYA